MNKADRIKHEGFVLAELARGGKLEVMSGRRGAAPKYLRTIEDVVIELPSTAIARALIDACKVVRKACQDGWFITPMTPFDAGLAGKRRMLYQISMGQTYQHRYSTDEKRADKIKTVTHIVTPFGVFGQCGINGTHETIAAARKVLKKALTDYMTAAKKDHRKAIDNADEALIEARILFEQRIKDAMTVEVSDE